MPANPQVNALSVGSNRTGRGGEPMQGIFPYTCRSCGVVCASLAELADPDHHDEPNNGRQVPVA